MRVALVVLAATVLALVTVPAPAQAITACAISTPSCPGVVCSDIPYGLPGHGRPGYDVCVGNRGCGSVCPPPDRS
ncbi:MAG TPA: hypothetical protein VI997_07060 [Candidatus Thermoplasmatota archaeon]|nr:hypothetical protein [Candidatus Thermoplasmatota archaeon]